MAVDLAIKVAHLARDFRATLDFVAYLPYELEKRIIARLGLVKIEALHSIIGAYKNELKRTMGTTKTQEIATLEGLIDRLRTDIDGGIRAARNAQVGHVLALPIAQIPEQWLFMCHSTYTILAQDLSTIETAIQAIDPAYATAPPAPALAPALLQSWALPTSLGPPGQIRFAQIYAGPWTPGLVSMVPGGHQMQDASLRVFGLRLMIRQVGLILMPFIANGGYGNLYGRLLHELALIDLYSLEEAIYQGNAPGNTASLVSEWTAVGHNGVGTLQAGQATLDPSRIGWRDDIRNKVCAHMDPNVPKSMLDPTNWPMVLNSFYQAIALLCTIAGDAADKDIRTKLLTAPVRPLSGVLGLANQPPDWANT